MKRSPIEIETKTAPGCQEAVPAVASTLTATPSTAEIASHVEDSPAMRATSRYEIIAEHGRGGLGRVSRARDRELGRDVAIKELLQRTDLSELRFFREAMITARLEHPAIVPVHEVGRWPDGTPFYAMKLVAGRPLRDLIAERNTVAQRLELLHHLIAVADAIAYAHGRNIIHRDLKPANVIVGDFGETIVIDWGLAKDLGSAGDSSSEEHDRSQVELTNEGSVLGTPSYMAPEQARGERVDQRADVFAIGAMLWELCSLQKVPPQAPRGQARMLRRANIDEDLATIIGKALSTDPRKRYANASELAADLNAFKAGARIASRRYSVTAVVARWVRRHRALTATMAAATAALIVGAIVYVLNVSEARNRASREAADAVAARDALALKHAETLLALDPTAAKEVVDSYHGSDTQHAKRIAAEAIGRGVARTVQRAHTNEIWFIATDETGAIYSLGMDRRLRVTQHGQTTTLADDAGSMDLRDYAPEPQILAYTTSSSGVAILRLPKRERTMIRLPRVVWLALSRDGRYLGTIDITGTVSVRELTAANPIVYSTQDSNVRSIDFAGNLVVMNTESEVRTISLDPGHEIRLMALPVGRAVGGDNYIAMSGRDGSITVSSLSFTKQARFQACQKEVTSLAAFPHREMIAFACSEGAAGILRYQAGSTQLEVVTRLETHGPAYNAQPDESGQFVIISGDFPSCYVYDMTTDTITEYSSRSPRVPAVIGPRSGFNYFVTGDANGVLRTWDPPSRHNRVVERTADIVFQTKFSPDGKLLAIAGGDHIVHILDIQSRNMLHLAGHTDTVYGLSFDPRDDSLRTFGLDGTIKLWDTGSGQLRKSIDSRRTLTNDSDFLRQTHELVLANDDGQLEAWSADLGSVRTLLSSAAPLQLMEALQPTGHIVVRDLPGNMWDVGLDGQHKLVKAADHTSVLILRASIDGKWLATGGDDGIVTLHRTADWSIASTRNIGVAINQIVFDPKSRHYVVVTEDGAVQLIEVPGYNIPLPWHKLEVPARGASYNSTGNRLALPCADGSTWFYDFTADEWVYVRDHRADMYAAGFSPDDRV